MPQAKRIMIAELLQSKGLLSAEQVQTALARQKASDKKIGEIIVEMGALKKEELLKTLAEQLNIPYINLNDYAINADTVQKLPEIYARNLRALVLRHDSQHYLIGMVDPQDIIAQEEISKILNAPLQIALIAEDEFLRVADTIYRRTEDISRYAETLSAELKPAENPVFLDESLAGQDLPVVRLLRSIFEDAVQTNASDIHIEPGENYLRIRFRVDGILQEQIVHENDVAEALVQRVKLGAGMNIAEKRLPQDGRFSITVKNMLFDVRVSTIPIQFGESLVMRLLNQSSSLLNIHDLQMPDVVLQQYARLLTSSYGLLLVVGPTGSGKTTTLYASLNELDQVSNKIITVEDPVEYRFPAINQVNVNPKIDLTFATVLRSILRQDPDIVLVGELRDYETLEIALRAAMTGHFVLSTLHTHDAISSVMRMMDMGAASYLIASVLRGVMAQRLVRQICDNCRTTHAPSAGERAWLSSLNMPQALQADYQRGKGCTYCHFTGFKGRVGVFELLTFTQPLIEALRDGDINGFAEKAKEQTSYQPLVQSGLARAMAGQTTIDEVIHMAGELC